jgi:hypothetical protein
LLLLLLSGRLRTTPIPSITLTLTTLLALLGVVRIGPLF